MTDRLSLAAMERGTFWNVQALRFIAAAAILVLHAADIFIPDAWGFWTAPWPGGVDIFFVISGFIMAWLMRGRFGDGAAARAFLVRRFIRIVPVYWLFTALMIAMLWLAGRDGGFAVPDGTQVATSFLFLPWPNAGGHLVPVLPQGWTLNYEALFYLCFAAALPFRRGLVWLAALFVALVALHPFVRPGAVMLRFWSDPIILEFLGGMALAEAHARGLRLPPWASLAFAAVAAILFLLLQDVPLGMFERVARLGLPALLLSAGLILAPEPTRPGALCRALRHGGDISYTLYLSHIFTVAAAAWLWRRSGIDLPWLGMAVAMVLAVAAASLLYRWIERPLVDGLKRAARVEPAPPAADVAP